MAREGVSTAAAVGNPWRMDWAVLGGHVRYQVPVATVATAQTVLLQWIASDEQMAQPRSG